MTTAHDSAAPADPASGTLTYPFHDWSQQLSPHYARLRASGPPVCPVVSAYTGDRLWLVTRYATAVQVLEDARLSSAAAMASGSPRQEPVELRAPGTRGNAIALLKEAGLRAVLADGLGPRAVRRHQEWIRQRAGHLMHGLVERRDTIDLAGEFALPLARQTASRTLLGGLGADEEEQLVRWADLGLRFCGATPQQQVGAFTDMHRFFLAQARRLADSPGEHLLKTVAATCTDGGRLSDEGLAEVAELLVVAGYPTSAGFLCGALITLLNHPEVVAALNRDPALIPSAVEELLRHTPLATGSAKRRATEDVQVDGVTIKAGEVVMVSMEAVNHDPEAFEDPDAFILGRQGPAHLGFGRGLHFCPGNRLARCLIEAMVRAVADRPGLRLSVAPEDIRWHEGLFFRRPEAIPASW
ncbi:cytochrome P450 [Streptomyces sp. NPDC007100]|uniref:cytochrome P450 n=1 Tax=Streptomyces sp. NPDC007100 TaxID=3155602 RepID=UPI0033DCCB75